MIGGLAIYGLASSLLLPERYWEGLRLLFRGEVTPEGVGLVSALLIVLWLVGELN